MNILTLLSEPTGLWGLFLVSFAAATLLPLGSEWLLSALVLAGEPLTACLAVATLGNTLGSCTCYLIGRGGSGWLLDKGLRLTASQRERSERLFNRYGSWALFFAWLPVVGDPLCITGGLLRVRFGRFLLPVASGKFLRYLAVALLTVNAVG